MDDDALNAILEDLATAVDLDDEAFERTYRSVILAVHPDAAGGDARRFMRARDAFAELREMRSRARRRAVFAEGLDPHAVLRDVGAPETITPRGALMVALYRFRALGIDRRRVRAKPELRRRNALVIRTVLYWAQACDTEFASVFEAMLRHEGAFGISGPDAFIYARARRTVLRGLDWIVRYHDTGRPAAAAIARDAATGAAVVIGPFAVRREFAVLDDLSRWIARESERPSELLALRL